MSNEQLETMANVIETNINEAAKAGNARAVRILKDMAYMFGLVCNDCDGVTMVAKREVA